jgi:hypothetical protein
LSPFAVFGHAKNVLLPLPFESDGNDTNRLFPSFFLGQGSHPLFPLEDNFFALRSEAELEEYVDEVDKVSSSESTSSKISLNCKELLLLVRLNAVSATTISFTSILCLDEIVLVDLPNGI